VVTICTTSLTFNNSTFCPHSVFMCFVWISEQTVNLYKSHNITVILKNNNDKLQSVSILSKPLFHNFYVLNQLLLL